MGKKKKGGQTEDKRTENGPPPEPSIELTWAAIFLLAAVLVFGHAAHSFLNVEYAPAFLGLALFLALIGWTSGGGMGEAKNFNQKNGIMGMGFALIFIVAIACQMNASSKEKAELVNDTAKNWKPSMDDVLDPKSGQNTPTPPMTQPTGQRSKSAMGLLAALKNAPPAMPEGPPDEAQMQRAGECARRFFWGFINKDDAVMEGECSMEYGEKVIEMAAPSEWEKPKDRLALDSIKITDQSYNGSAITVDLNAGNRQGQVSLTKDIDWEVTGFVPKP